ncbi:sigma-54-dependent Fis family transcriptional regulator [Vogesella mureinivorans]|uniref:sigma-54-dependent Fis family transcriptional regulator n=1 Tax=Vogesella mureinivorans TaxID=657276 RepID=UPI0011CB9139|nr:sigma-54-dependent Fis family transcriptional regulator [Vogesella mureinivorans]
MSTLPLAEIRRRFFDGDELPENSVPQPILHSWRRCLGLGLSAARLRPPERLDSQRLTLRQQDNADWLQLARPAIDALFDSVVDEGHVVIVADRDGVILNQMGHPAFLDRAERVALLPGMDWREDVRGTNAIGTALVTGSAVRVRGSEHYLERNRQLSCTASTIVDPQGQMLGVLDVSGLPRKLGEAQQLQVVTAVRHIEQRLFDEHTRSLHELRFAPDPATLATPRCARLAFDDDGVLRAANRAALALLGLDWHCLGQTRFAGLSGLSMEHWLSRHGSGIASLRHGGQLYSASLLPPRQAAANHGTALLHTGLPPSSPRRPAAAARHDSASDKVGRKQDLALPPGMLDTARRLLEADIPVLVLGETGAGKERFVQALHRISSRAAAPLVAVNCAAIPEGLIESELFGYEEGAFTGARRQGAKGRLREADGGVLFLDEIGDMPMSLQARLLRVLQERLVVPLGGGAGQKVDVRIVAATHRQLEQEVAAGRFRADLYYRLCHYPLTLPPLRERGDVAQIAANLLLQHGSAARGITLSPALADFIRRYPWPGNLRQLDNLLRTLLALADDGTVLTPDHLPATLRGQDAGPRHTAGTLHSLLQQHGGNASAAARALGISRSTFYRRLREGGHTA